MGGWALFLDPRLLNPNFFNFHTVQEKTLEAKKSNVSWLHKETSHAGKYPRDKLTLGRGEAFGILFYVFVALKEQLYFVYHQSV